MNSRKRKSTGPRQPRKRTKPDAIRTNIAIITYPATSEKTVDLRRDIELAKAALLYGDNIEILSLGQQMIQGFHDFSAGPDEAIMALLQSLDDGTLSHLSDGKTDPEQLRQAFTMIGSLDPDLVRFLGQSSPEMAPLAEFADILAQTRDKMASGMQEFRDVTEQMHLDSGAAELDVAFRAGLVRYNTRVALSGDTQAIVGAFSTEIKKYLEDPKKFVLLDQQVASLVRSMIKEGVVKIPTRSTANAGEALLGTGFLARLPTFPDAGMEQVVDLRSGLEEPLSRYRRKVADLRSHMLTGPFDEHAEAEVNGIWRTEVDPAIIEIRQAMADHSLSKQLIREAGEDIAKFVTGAFTRGGLAVLAANTLDVNTAVTAGLAGASTAIPIAARALTARKRGRDAAKANDLYYLHAVDKELEA